MNPKYALITGATSGIGYELAKVFANEGFNLVIVARTQADLERVSSDLSIAYEIEVVPIAKDLSLKESPFELYEEIKERGIKIDVLVNDAAQGVYGKFIDTDIRKELDILQLNI